MQVTHPSDLLRQVHLQSVGRGPRWRRKKA